MNKNLLVIGSNFGIIHAKAAYKSNIFEEIVIASPNILDKNIPNHFKKSLCYQKSILSKKFFMISIATVPTVQHEIIQFIFMNDIKVKYIFLEKPILKKTLTLLSKFDDRIYFNVNFIFCYNDQWIKFNNLNIVNNSNLEKISYKWHFRQAFFSNNLETWKIKTQFGGGLINYYLPHVIANMIFIFKDIRFKFINKFKFTNEYLTYLSFVFDYGNSEIHIEINSNSKLNKHLLEIKSDGNLYSLKNNSKFGWTAFDIYKNKKEIYTKTNLKNNYIDNRFYELLYQYVNYKKVFKKNISKNTFIFKTFRYIDLISKNVEQKNKS